MQIPIFFFALGLTLASCKSVELDLTDLQFPMMLNDYAHETDVDADAQGTGFDYIGRVSERQFTHGFNGGGSRTTLVNNAQEAAYQKVGGSETAGITNIQLHLTSSSTYPLLWVSQFVEIEARGIVREER